MMKEVGNTQKNSIRVQIIGAGLAGLTAAHTLAEHGISCNLISLQPSERAQSVLAEGGINGALNTMGEEDSRAEHMADTIRSGAGIADETAVQNLTQNAPDMIRFFAALGVPFHTENGVIKQRNFGGQKKKRTAFAKSSTGKMLMSALIDEVRKHEAAGLVTRFSHHEFLTLRLNVSDDGTTYATGVVLKDAYRKTVLTLTGPVILAFGGMNGMFPGRTTGTNANSADAAAAVFAQGITFGNLEMIQYHPTTIGISGKRCLISEAARGEGGRLFIRRNGQPWYFMEEKYPELGNLMPRDVVSREMFFVRSRSDCDGEVCLDLTGLSADVWKKKLPDLREEVSHYMHIDPAKVPVPVEPGIHYFMGGIHVDAAHRTNLPGVYAAGECCCQYHGANRLGGNSLLGAAYGGRVAAETLISALSADALPGEWLEGIAAASLRSADEGMMPLSHATTDSEENDLPDERERCRLEAQAARRVGEVLAEALSIVRNQEGLDRGLRQLEALLDDYTGYETIRRRIFLAKAMVLSAMLRKESRGAHYREDYPATDEAQQKMTLALMEKEDVFVAYQK